jgi:integrase
MLGGQPMTRPYPTNVIPRGGKLYIKVKMPDGRWKQASTGFTLDQVEAASELQRRTQDQLDNGIIEELGELTLGQWATKWLKARADDQAITSHYDDGLRIRDHLQGTALARMPIKEVRPRHVLRWVKDLRATTMAPRTLRTVAGLVRTIFRDAVIEELIHASPFVLRRGDLPPVVDKDPEWRSSAIYTRAEVEMIVGARDVLPLDRVVLYSVCFLGGLRLGEVLALRWRHISPDLEPLGRIVVAGSYNSKLKREKSTKTQAVRSVPIHKVLAKTLAQWRLSGWEEAYGRKPTDDDLILPSRLNDTKCRHAARVLMQFHLDLDTLQLRRRRIHDARRTFRSLCADDDGSERAIEWIVYGRKSSVSGRYDEPSWQALCEPVLKLKIKPRGTVLTMVQRGAGSRKG